MSDRQSESETVAGVHRQVRRMMGVLAGGLVVMALAAKAADAQRTVARRPEPEPPGKSLEASLAEPIFNFSPAKDGTKRRDPFKIPLTKINVEKGPGVLPPGGYQALAKKEAARLQALQACLKALRIAVAANDDNTVLATYQRLEEGLEQEFAITTNQIGRDTIRSEFESLKPRISGALVAAALASARVKVKSIKEAFDANRHEDVDLLAGEFEKLGAIPETEASPEWKVLNAQVAALARRARARMAFKKKPIRVTSVMVSSRGGVAVINDHTCMNGSRLDEETLVARISSDAIVFVYQGEEIEYRIGSR